MHLRKQSYSCGNISSGIKWKVNESAMLLYYRVSLSRNREGMMRGLESANIGKCLHDYHTQRSNHWDQVKSFVE